MRRNGNGSKGANGGGESVPRWVRVLFDQHEARMAKMERAHEEHIEAMAKMKAEHEARMAEMERQTATIQREEIETRRQTREIIAQFARMDAQRAKDSKALAEALRDVRGDVSRLKRG